MIVSQPQSLALSLSNEVSRFTNTLTLSTDGMLDRQYSQKGPVVIGRALPTETDVVVHMQRCREILQLLQVQFSHDKRRKEKNREVSMASIGILQSIWDNTDSLVAALIAIVSLADR